MTKRSKTVRVSFEYEAPSFEEAGTRDIDYLTALWRNRFNSDYVIPLDFEYKRLQIECVPEKR